jgi:hypothetical protein
MAKQGTIIIFLGPSLSHESAKKILPEAEFRPPAKKGDLLRLAANPNLSMVGLVDGVFLQDYPPTPIEVYQLAMRKDVTFAGAASLGALRAVELEKFGMIGIGKVFELYKKGKIDADDEVAVTFGSEDKDDGSRDFRIQSEAMIDIRYNLFLAHKKGVISQGTKKVIAKVAKKIYFPYRNYADIIDEAGQKYPELRQEIEAFRTYIKSNRTSLKQKDAIKLLEFFKARISNT